MIIQPTEKGIKEELNRKRGVPVLAHEVHGQTIFAESITALSAYFRDLGVCIHPMQILRKINSGDSWSYVEKIEKNGVEHIKRHEFFFDEQQ